MRASCASGLSVEVIESKFSRRSAVRSSAWLGRLCVLEHIFAWDVRSSLGIPNPRIGLAVSATTFGGHDLNDPLETLYVLFRAVERRDVVAVLRTQHAIRGGGRVFRNINFGPTSWLVGSQDCAQRVARWQFICTERKPGIMQLAYGMAGIEQDVDVEFLRPNAKRRERAPHFTALDYRVIIAETLCKLRHVLVVHGLRH
jgi:hypothetical protein